MNDATNLAAVDDSWSSINYEGTRKSPPAAAGGRPGRVVPVSFDGPSNALNRSSERSYNCE